MQADGDELARVVVEMTRAEVLTAARGVLLRRQRRRLRRYQGLLLVVAFLGGVVVGVVERNEAVTLTVVALWVLGALGVWKAERRAKATSVTDPTGCILIVRSLKRR